MDHSQVTDEHSDRTNIPSVELSDKLVYTHFVEIIHFTGCPSNMQINLVNVFHEYVHDLNIDKWGMIFICWIHRSATILFEFNKYTCIHGYLFTWIEYWKVRITFQWIHIVLQPLIHEIWWWDFSRPFSTALGRTVGVGWTTGLCAKGASCQIWP